MAAKKETVIAKFYQGTGRRKEATATARLVDERGPLLVNGVPIDQVFAGEMREHVYLAPFKAVGMLNKFRGDVRVNGGGKTGQLGAVVLAVSRALMAFDESLRPTLAKNKLLTRDPRMVERKKVFHDGARRAPQYSKR